MHLPKWGAPQGRPRHPQRSPQFQLTPHARRLWARGSLHPRDPPLRRQAHRTHVRPFPSVRSVPARAPRRPTRAPRRPGAPRPSPPRHRRTQSPALGFGAPQAAQSPRLPARPPPRSARQPRASRAAPLARAAPAAAAGNILRLRPLLPSRTAPAAACTAGLPAPLAPVPALPIGPRTVAPRRSQWAAGAGAAPTGPAAKG